MLRTDTPPLLTWRFFTNATQSSLHVIKQRSTILSNIVIPSEIFVLTENFSAMISFTLEFTILIPLVALLTGAISYYVVLFPLIHILYLLVAFGLSLILASLYPYLRDLGEIWPFVLQLGFFLCPIMYSISIVPKSIQGIYLLNPVTQIMIMYRDIVLYGVLPSLMQVGYILLFGISIVFIGHFLFKRLEKGFVEVI